MIDKPEMHLLLQTMERAAKDVLQHDPAFFETLHALKAEIERTPRVQVALNGLQRLGNGSFTSFVPRINVRVRTKNGVHDLTSPGLTYPSQMRNSDPQFQSLTEELRAAAAEVINGSNYRKELNVVVNEAISSSDIFEGIASRIEHEGYEVIICLDFSTDTQVRGNRSSLPRRSGLATSECSAALSLSTYDLTFLTTLGIRTDL